MGQEVNEIIETKTLECNELKEELRNEKSHSMHLRDITNQNREQHSVAISKLETKLNETKKKLKNEEIDRLDRTSMVEAREAKLRELKEEMDRENKKAEAELEDMIQKFRDFEHAVLS